MKFAKGSFRNIYAIRFEPGEDVLLGLQKFCEDHGVGHGAILSGIGSLEGCSFFDPDELPGKPGLYGYGAPIELPCPIELTSLSGIICTEESGKPSLHVHATFADKEGKEYGGHFKEGNRVLTTVELVISELGGINMSRRTDPNRGVMVFEPIQL